MVAVLSHLASKVEMVAGQNVTYEFQICFKRPTIRIALHSPLELATTSKPFG